MPFLKTEMDLIMEEQESQHEKRDYRKSACDAERDIEERRLEIDGPIKEDKGAGRIEKMEREKTRPLRKEKNEHRRNDIEHDHQKPIAFQEQVLEKLQRRNPSYDQITISNKSASVSFSGLGNQRAADRYTFDARTGEITGTTLYKDAAASGKMRGWIYSVHVGEWGGMLTRVLWFLAALIGTSLPLTGYYLWIRRLRHKSFSKTSSAHR